MFDLFRDLCESCEIPPEPQNQAASLEADQDDSGRLEFWTGFDVSKCPHFDLYELAEFIRDHCNPFQVQIFGLWLLEMETGRTFSGRELQKKILQEDDKWYNRFKQERDRLRKKIGKFLGLQATVKKVKRKCCKHSPESLD